MTQSYLKRPFLLITTVFLFAVLLDSEAATLNPLTGYGNNTEYYTLPYANHPGFGAANPLDPTIALVIDNTSLTIPLDTGSRALYVSADLVPANISLNGPAGFVYLNSSGRIFNGTWTNTTVTFPDAVGSGGATGPAVATMLVLVVQSVTASPNPQPGMTTPGATFGTQISSGNITLADGTLLPFTNSSVFLQPGQVANYTANKGILSSSENFGVGFDRTGPGTSPNSDQYNQQYDAFLNIDQMRAGTMIAGYILTPTAVQLGLVGNTTGFAYTNLVPTGLSQVPGSPPDWQAPMGTVVYGNQTYDTGQLVLDIGIPHGILTLPGQPTSGNVTEFPIGVNLINSNGAVSYQINTDPDNILNPVASSESVALPWFPPLPGDFSENMPPYNATLFNTGRNVINAFDFLYDATDGFLGVKPNGVSVPSADILFTAGFYPNPVNPIAPFIVSQPLNEGAVAGAVVSFTVAARGTPNPEFQWQISANNGRTWKNLANGNGFQGAATDSLQINTKASMNNNQFRVVASNPSGNVTGSAAVLLLGVPPAITYQPMARTIRPGLTAVFHVVATGRAPLQYAWYFNNEPLANSGNVSGATSSALIISKVTTANTGYYHVVVTNPIGSATSKTAALTVP